MVDAGFDAQMMAIALRMARRGLGLAAPNPSVGALIVDEWSSEVIARAVTSPGGRPHAEPQAIAAAGSRSRGATLYVTLEPCSHQGRTPPCTDAIIASGIKRVVACIEDPDPRVAGRGLERLRSCGILITRGVLAEDARWVTRGHIVRITERRPFTVLKLAVANDGSVPRGKFGHPTWVTGPQARARGHLLRAEADAVLVGAATVRDDDPLLTCRLPGLAARSPVRVVASASLDIPLKAKLVQSAREVPVWIITTEGCDEGRKTALINAGVEVVETNMVGGQLWLPAIMEALVARGITRLLVEGGPTLWRAFAAASLVDEVAMFVAGTDIRDADASLALVHSVLGPLPLAVRGTMDLETDSFWRFDRRRAQEGC